MKRQGAFLILLLGTFGLQCPREETPVSLEHEHVHSESSAGKDSVRLTTEATEAVGLETEEVKFQVCRLVLEAMGKVLAPQPQTAIVTHAFPARVAEVHVQIGDWVEKGRLLVTLESNEVGEAKANFYKAIADRELTGANLVRQKRLLDSGIGVKKNYLEAETAEKIAESNAEAAEKTLHVLGFTEEQVKEIANTHQINPTIDVYSPISGTVVENSAVLGAMVDQTTPMLTIIDLRLLWVDAEVYEKDIAKVEIGQLVEITAPAYPGVVFEGKVSYIGDIVDEETRTITVRADVANEDRRLKPGMFADVNIVLDASRRMLVVPAAAILEEGDQKSVFVKEDDHFVRREVEVGEIEGDEQQIVKGLKAGEQVVVQGNHELRSKLHEEVLRAAHTH